CIVTGTSRHWVNTFLQCSYTCFGVAIPVVSASVIPAAPSSRYLSINIITLSSSMLPSNGHPKAVASVPLMLMPVPARKLAISWKLEKDSPTVCKSEEHTSELQSRFDLV